MSKLDQKIWDIIDQSPEEVISVIIVTDGSNELFPFKVLESNRLMKTILEAKVIAQDLRKAENVGSIRSIELNETYKAI